MVCEITYFIKQYFIVIGHMRQKMDKLSDSLVSLSSSYPFLFWRHAPHIMLKTELMDGKRVLLNSSSSYFESTLSVDPSGSFVMMMIRHLKKQCDYISGSYSKKYEREREGEREGGRGRSTRILCHQQ